MTFAAGDMYFFGYSSEKPHVQYSVADATGHIIRNVAFNLREPIMMHDFAVSQDYALFLDVPLFFRVQVCSPPVIPCNTLACALPVLWYHSPG